MALPEQEEGRVHSAGLVKDQPPDPDFYVHFNTNNLGRQRAHSEQEEVVPAQGS
jgi:predicted P-loop ATPase